MRIIQIRGRHGGRTPVSVDEISMSAARSNASVREALYFLRNIGRLSEDIPRIMLLREECLR